MQQFFVASCIPLYVTSHDINEFLWIYFSILIFIRFFFHCPGFLINLFLPNSLASHQKFLKLILPESSSLGTLNSFSSSSWRSPDNKSVTTSLKSSKVILPVVLCYIRQFLNLMFKPKSFIATFHLSQSMALSLSVSIAQKYLSSLFSVLQRALSLFFFLTFVLPTTQS